LKKDYKYARIKGTDENGVIKMIQSGTGISRASQILAELEAKRRGPIDAIIEKQRLAVREDLLKGIDDDHDEYLEKGNKIVKRIETAEKELDKVRSEVQAFATKAKDELLSTKKQIDDAVQTVNTEISRLVDRANRLRELNDNEEEDYKKQVEREEFRDRLTTRRDELKEEIRNITQQMKDLRVASGNKSMPKEVEARAVAVYKEYKANEGKNHGAIIAMLDQRIAEMRDAHSMSVASSQDAADKLSTLLQEKAEFEIKIAKQRDELYDAALTEIVARGLTEFFEVKSE
jgi:chromosome segregation ATPase